MKQKFKMLSPALLGCGAPKLLPSKLGRILQDMKLNKTKIRCILRQNRNHPSTKEIGTWAQITEKPLPKSDT